MKMNPTLLYSTLPYLKVSSLPFCLAMPVYIIILEEKGTWLINDYFLPFTGSGLLKVWKLGRGGGGKK